MNGMVASSFTAYISHTLTDCWWKRGRPRRDSVWGFGERWGPLCVNCMHVYKNVLVGEGDRERRGLLGGLKE